MNSEIPLKDLVLVGGGHAHVHVMKMLGMKPIPHLRITLISRDCESPYSGMIPGYIAGYYTREDCHIDIMKLASFSKIRFIHTEVTYIDTDQKLIYTKDSSRPPIRYDILSIDIGIIPKPLPVSISSEVASIQGRYGIDLSITPVKPIDSFAYKWEKILNRVMEMSTISASDKLKIAIVGGGAGGTELAFAINFRLKELLSKQNPECDPSTLVEVHLLNKSEAVMNHHSK
jgi:selenide,water dikinase